MSFLEWLTVDRGDSILGNARRMTQEIMALPECERRGALDQLKLEIPMVYHLVKDDVLCPQEGRSSRPVQEQRRIDL